MSFEACRGSGRRAAWRAAPSGGAWGRSPAAFVHLRQQPTAASGRPLCALCAPHRAPFRTGVVLWRITGCARGLGGGGWRSGARGTAACRRLGGWLFHRATVSHARARAAPPPPPSQSLLPTRGPAERRKSPPGAPLSPPAAPSRARAPPKASRRRNVSAAHFRAAGPRETASRAPPRPPPRAPPPPPPPTGTYGRTDEFHGVLARVLPSCAAPAAPPRAIAAGPNKRPSKLFLASEAPAAGGRRAPRVACAAARGPWPGRGRAFWGSGGVGWGWVRTSRVGGGGGV